MNEKLEIKGDERGVFVEVFKMPGFGQVSYSTTVPGVTRGNHYHTRKIEKFCVIEGKALIRMRNREDNEIREYEVSGEKPEIIETIINWTHNIKNTGDAEMKLLLWANEVFDPSDADTFKEKV